MVKEMHTLDLVGISMKVYIVQCTIPISFFQRDPYSKEKAHRQTAEVEMKTLS